MSHTLYVCCIRHSMLNQINKRRSKDGEEADNVIEGGREGKRETKRDSHTSMAACFELIGCGYIHLSFSHPLALDPHCIHASSHSVSVNKFSDSFLITPTISLHLCSVYACICLCVCVAILHLSSSLH